MYNLEDYLLMCPYCSATFSLDLTNGTKNIFGDHYIVPNSTDAQQIKDLSIEWLKRLHHRSSHVEDEFSITQIEGFSLPFWVISLECHTSWKGLVKKHRPPPLNPIPGSDYIVEQGVFHRSYRWCVSGRKNIMEHWGLIQLHEPKENILVEWDGFPLDSTFSRGRLQEGKSDRQAYDARDDFEFKYANGLPILNIQVDEQEALRRAQAHVNLYHYRLSKLHADILTEHRSEQEIAGVQLIHLPFWHIMYFYQPRGVLKNFYTPKEKNILMDGYSVGVLSGELALVKKDKILINASISLAGAVVFLLIGVTWHPAFFLISFFALVVSVASFIMGAKQNKTREIQLKKENTLEKLLQKKTQG